MELCEYTDEQLHSELKRRAVLRAKQTRESSLKEPYLYWEGIVKGIYVPSYDKSIIRIEFSIEPLSDYIKSKTYKSFSTYRVLSGFGFKRSNLPKVGDRVKLRYRNNIKHELSYIHHSRIIEVLERVEN